jgi:hypothetical protein
MYINTHGKELILYIPEGAAGSGLRSREFHVKTLNAKTKREKKKLLR